ncbi:oxidoreductase [Azospirillum sp. Vi22]|nr:oxidoreductase [Azospirillum baldaniorum]
MNRHGSTETIHGGGSQQPNHRHRQGHGSRSGRDYDERGFISMDWIVTNTPTQEAACCLCGPRPFLRAMVGGLAGRGVPLGNIQYEFFGPTDELLAA